MEKQTTERKLSKDEMNLSLRKRLFDLYNRAAAYINGEGEDSAEYDIVSEGAQIYVEYTEYMNEFAKAVIIEDFESVNNAFLIIGKCYTIHNRDFDHEVTYEEWMEMTCDIVEEISGFLGAFFDD